MRLSMRNIAWLGSLSLGLLGCGGSDQPVQPADTAASGTTAEVAETADLETLLTNADVKRGETLYFQCRACHTVEQDGFNKVGPTLWGVFGREAGTAPGFAYSDALKNSSVVWTPETINAWLEQPADYLPGNIMVFVGVKDPQDRANLIAYLQVETNRPAD